jgi:hypothetical protein
MGAAAITQKLLGQQQKDSISNLLSECAAAFGKKLAPLEAEAYIGAWSKLAVRVGRMRVEAAVKRAIAELQYFPKLEQLESRIPNVHLIGRADDQCRICGGTGWEYTFEGFTCGSDDGKKNPVHKKIGAVRRCVCWQKTEIA